MGPKAIDDFHGHVIAVPQVAVVVLQVVVVVPQAEVVAASQGQGLSSITAVRDEYPS